MGSYSKGYTFIIRFRRQNSGFLMATSLLQRELFQLLGANNSQCDVDGTLRDLPDLLIKN